MSEQLTAVRGWSVEGFRAFWAQRDLTMIPRVLDLCTPDIVGHWPRPIGLVKNAVPYVDVISAIFAVCPDLRMTAPDYARDGDRHFVRWHATGTGPDGVPFAFDGIDRILTTPDGRVAENYVCSDGPLFGWVADYLKR